MSIDWQEGFYQLRYQAKNSSYGDALPLTRRMIDMADAHNDIHLGIEARLEFIEAAVFSDLTYQALPHYWWCLKHLDENPDEYGIHEEDIVFRYKWIITDNEEWLSVKKSDILALRDDMIHRLDRLNIGAYTIADTDISIAIAFGNLEGLEEKIAYLATLETDEQSDCPACVKNHFVIRQFLLGNYENVIEYGRPIRTGELTCHTVPKSTWPYMAEAALHLSREDLLYDGFNSLHKIINEEQDGYILGSYLWLAALIGKLNDARPTMRRLLDSDDSDRSDYYRLMCRFGIWCFLNRMTQAGNEEVSTNKGSESILNLMETQQKFFREMAMAFDQRNGNKFISDGLQRRVESLNERLLSP